MFLSNYNFISVVVFIIFSFHAFSQEVIRGTVKNENDEILPFANVFIEGKSIGTTTDEHGKFSLEILLEEEEILVVSYIGYLSISKKIMPQSSRYIDIEIRLNASPELDEVVVTGTMKEMTRKDSPVPVEVYSPTFFKKNPSPSLYESLHNVNGVRPQLNCNVCNTGDIHINGLEGPYTMVMIDGMPIVSGLSTVYGLMGIPNSMIERVEIIKGPASSLYGSEAIGGLVNVITKNPSTHAKFSAEIMSTSWMENQVDMAFRLKPRKKIDVLTGTHFYRYQNPIDNNGDNFTDVTLTDRFSVFQKWNIHRRKNRLFTVGGRYYYENRWGGEMQYTPVFRGTDSIYGESIETNRIEIFSKYQLPLKEKVLFWFSFNHHNQDSYYGTMPFMADQTISFAQFTWEKKLGLHHLTSGLSNRYTLYDDNTVATGDSINNTPQNVNLPGLFIQDDIILSESSRFLLGLRYDEHQTHGSIITPRIAYKWTINEKNSIRFNIGTGFRTVNVFTEDHAALTGARNVVFTENLDPERSVNYNVNYLKKIYSNKGNYWAFDASFFHSRFSNKIIADYDSDPDLILYDNLQGHAISQGFSVNLDAVIWHNIRLMAGITFTDVFSREKDEDDNWLKIRPVLTEKWSSTWSLSYTLSKYRLTFDYTSTLYSPMRLPLLGPSDPRNEYSPWWSLQNIQVTWKSRSDQWEFFSGIKNLLNYLPPSNSISRSNDPFDKKVKYNSDGEAIASSENPYALTFDPSYVFAPNQGIRFYLGFRFLIF